MEAYRYPIILACVLLYLLLCVGVGIWALRRTRSASDFFVAGRQLGFMVTGLAMFSSTLSGFGFVGGPGLVYAMGMSSIWIVITAPPGMAVSTYLLTKRLRMLAELRDTISLPDAVAARYGSESTRLLSAVAILLGVMGYLATQILAMALVMQSLLQHTAAFAGISLPACVAVSCAVLVFYSVAGGVIAGVYTDVLQGAIMIFASILVFVAALAAVDGGATGAVTALLHDDPESIGPWGSLGIMGCLSWYFLFTVGGAGQPHIITKNMMFKRLEDAPKILPVALGAYTFSALLWIGIGLAMRAVVIQGTHPALAAADQAAPEFLQTYANPLLAGVVFAALFAAIMSTADAFLNIGAAALVHDIPIALRGRPARHELWWARTATAMLAAVAASFALYSYFVNDRLVALLGAFGWGTFAAALVPVVGIGFNWKRATPLAANTAIVVSLVLNLVIEVFNVSLPQGIHGGTLALLVSLALFFGISFASPAPQLDPDIEALMDI